MLAIDQQLHLPLFPPDHHRLLAELPDQVEGPLRLSTQGQLQDVLRHPLLQGPFHLVLHLKEALRRAEPAQRLVRPPVLVVLQPEGNALPGLLEARKLDPREELAVDRAPEALQLAQSHRMMRAALDVLHLVLL